MKESYCVACGEELVEIMEPLPDLQYPLLLDEAFIDLCEGDRFSPDFLRPYLRDLPLLVANWLVEVWYQMPDDDGIEPDATFWTTWEGDDDGADPLDERVWDESLAYYKAQGPNHEERQWEWNLTLTDKARAYIAKVRGE